MNGSDRSPEPAFTAARSGRSHSLVEYDPAWAAEFAAIGHRLRSALGPVAIRIDHIGSTAVPGLIAKPIIDIQASVATLEPVTTYRGAIESCGFAWRPDNPDRTKRYFREVVGGRETHVHVRRSGSLGEQLALVCRDFLRADPTAAAEYAELKRSLAPLLATDPKAYQKAKGPFVWSLFQRADAWAQRTGWEPGPTGA